MITLAQGILVVFVVAIDRTGQIVCRETDLDWSKVCALQRRQEKQRMSRAYYSEHPKLCDTK